MFQNLILLFVSVNMIGINSLQNPLFHHFYNFVMMIVKPESMPHVRYYHNLFIFWFTVLLKLKHCKRIQYFVRSALNTKKWSCKSFEVFLLWYSSHVRKKSPCCRSPYLTSVHKFIVLFIFLQRMLCAMTFDRFHSLQLRKK